MIDEQITIGDIRPGPYPVGPDDENDQRNNQSLLDMLDSCLSLISLARQWYEAVNTKPDVVSYVAIIIIIHYNLSITYLNIKLK